jgi:glycosyltransferase involved in cell wall biosynthesis
MSSIEDPQAYPDEIPPTRSTMTLRVLVNGVAARLGGGATYLVNHVGALSRVPGMHLTVYATGPVARRLAESCPGLEVREVPPRRTTRRLGWEQVALARVARAYDVVYSMGNFAILATGRPQVVLLQNAYHYGSTARSVTDQVGGPAYRFRVNAEAALAGASVRRATRVIAVSQTLAASVAEDFPGEPIDVVLGALPDDLDLSAAGPADGGEPYVLAVSHDYPHKDWDGLVATFLAYEDLPTLKLVGEPRSPRRRRAIAALVGSGGAHRVEMLGPVSDRATLGRLYRDARCCVVHSRLESFALTACEAMQCGIAVAAGDIPAHREVCGGYAHYYPLDDPAGLADAVRGAIASPRPPGATLKARTWDENAAETARILRAAAGW